MKDYWPLDDAVPSSLKKFYVVNEVLRAAEGYSQTWWPHLYRVKVIPMVDGQEFKDILNQANVDSDGNETGGTLRDIMSPYLKNLQINDALVAQAEADVPKSGYNTEKLFVLPVYANGVSQQNYISSNGNVSSGGTTANNSVDQSNSDSQPALMTALVSAGPSDNVVTPTQNILSYLVGDSIAPNGFSVRSLTYFPDNPNVGEYVLRTDYMPNVLFRWDSKKWQTVNEVRRAPLTGNNNQTQLGTFVNNTNTTKLSSGKVIDQRQALSKILSPRSDF
jgi:hypothetical protein